MNRKLKRIWRSATALCMAFVMMFSTCGTVFAENGGATSGVPGEVAPDGEILKYVSIGDSMANGYGFVGYKQNSSGADGYDFMSGAKMYGEGAYPLQFEEYLESKGYEVEHTKLATSAMLAEDLLYLLGGREEFDDGWAGYKDYVGNYSDEDLMPYIQAAVAEADIITMGIGNASFGAFLMHKVTDALGVFGAKLEEEEKLSFEDAIAVLNLDAEQYALVMEVYDYLESKLIAEVPVELVKQYNLEAIVDMMAYTTASYVVNYKLLVEKILNMNPDVEIILVGLLNTTYGMNVIDDNGEVILPFGDVMDALFGTLNAYMAGLPAVLQAQGIAKDAKLYYAEETKPQFICQEFENLIDNNWVAEDIRLDGATVRERNIAAYNGDLAGMISLALSSPEKQVSLPGINLDDVKRYEALDEISWTSFDADVDKLLSVAIYLGIEEAVARSIDTMDIPLTGLMTIAGDLSSVFTDLGTHPTTSPEATRLWLAEGLSGDVTKGMCKIYGLFKVGNGMSVHPTPAGHDSIAGKVIAAYEEKHTVQDETIENIKTALSELCKLLETYGPEVAAQVWAQWEEYGYVDVVNATIDELTAILEARYEVYTTETLPAVNASVAALTEQKDALTTQLADLNAQLAAKKAELEKVLSEQEIGSVTVPDININVELGNNEQTDIPEHECVVSVDGNAIVAELEAAIKDIEHAIVTVEALVADVEADIEDMVALATQIADAVASLETTIKDIVNAANDLKDAVKAVATVLTDESAGSILSTVVGTYETVRDVALEAANLLDITMVAAEETMADIDEMVVILSNDAEALYNKFVADLPGCIEQIPEEGKLLLGAAVLGLQKAYEEGEKLVNEKLAEELAALEAEYADDIEKAKDDLNAIQAEIQTEIDAKYAEAVAETQIKIEAAKVEAAEKVAALEAELKQYQDELAALGADVAEEVRQTIQAKIDRVTADIDTVSADLVCAVEHMETALQLTYEAIVAEVNALYAEAVVQLEKVYNDIMAELEAAKKALEEAAGKTLEELKEAIDKQIEEFNKIGEELSEELNSILEGIRENMNKIHDAVKGILSGSLESVEKLKNALEAMGAEALAELVDIIVAQINAMLLEATTADMVVDNEFKFVAIGDESAMAEGYVEKLAAAINAEAAENGVNDIEVVNNAKTGNTVAAERANLSDVTDADLVTIGFSNVTFLSNALDAAMSGNASFDWSGLLGEEALPYVEDILADIKAEIAALELDEESTAMLETIVEAMAYNAVEYAATLPGLISDIKAVNSDALIIIVGMYNPLADTTINVGGAEFDVSEYVDYLVDAVAVHGTAYAIISGDAIYVDARDVDVENTDKELSVLDLATLVYNKCAALYPNAVGDDYIAGEIADALDITYVRTEKLLGDVNDDGVVDSRDLVRLRRYFAKDGSVINALNSDVNEDGVVDSRDMTRLTKFFAQVDGVVLGK